MLNDGFVTIAWVPTGAFVWVRKSANEVQRKIILDNIGSDHGVAGVAQHPNHVTTAGSRLPEGVWKGLGTQQRERGARWRRIKVEASFALWCARCTCAHATGG